MAEPPMSAAPAEWDGYMPEPAPSIPSAAVIVGKQRELPPSAMDTTGPRGERRKVRCLRGVAGASDCFSRFGNPAPQPALPSSPRVVSYTPEAPEAAPSPEPAAEGAGADGMPSAADGGAARDADGPAPRIEARPCPIHLLPICDFPPPYPLARECAQPTPAVQERMPEASSADAMESNDAPSTTALQPRPDLAMPEGQRQVHRPKGSLWLRRSRTTSGGSGSGGAGGDADSTTRSAKPDCAPSPPAPLRVGPDPSPLVEDETRPTPLPRGEPMPEANATHPLSAAAGFPSLSVEDNVVASPAPAGRPALFHFLREVA